jgi:hypothetical protein
MKWKGAFALVVAAAAIAVPGATGGGATQIVDTWSHVSGDLFYAGDGLCNTSTVAGYLTDGSGIARTTLTANGGSLVRGESTDTWQLYNASGPPWDVVFGSFYATMTTHVSFEELVPPNGQTILGNVVNGRLTYPDGSWQTVHILFRMLIQPDSPPKLFLVKFVCG